MGDQKKAEGCKPERIPLDVRVVLKQLGLEKEQQAVELLTALHKQFKSN
ncbi:hypothetical protein IDH44_25575 [Paenibacillus sp. IB182496]|uniref:Uncharacterized protein n=1 Tax=Paenibacillus sabuli TaxID=2772509 RepID=A0A927BX91_9BACL|nr:hypothetical protein [Paenibacillus sabuli]MBD2848563.1 hypothetical protein [Paenibacillus sabuli]